MTQITKLFNKFDELCTRLMYRIGCDGCFVLLVALIISPLLISIIYKTLNESVINPFTEPIFESSPLYKCDAEPLLIILDPEGIIAYSDPRPDSDYAITLPAGSALKIIDDDIEFKTTFSGRWHKYSGYINWSKVTLIGLDLDINKKSIYWVISRDLSSSEVQYCHPIS